MLERADTPSGGIYSATGKYEYQEMASLVTELSKIIDIPVPALLRSFGNFLMGRFSELYPQFFESETDSLALLEKVENHVHIEVRKLYPDAELPTLDVVRQGPDDVMVRYISCRPLGDLAMGLIEGCATLFGDDVELSMLKKEDGVHIGVSRKNRQVAA